MSRFSRYAGSRPPSRVDLRGPARHPAFVTTPSSRGDLGDEIRRRRKAANLTQADLAKLAAVATTNVGKVEKGRPVSDTTLRAVARALELPPELVAPFLSDPPSESRDLRGGSFAAGRRFSGDDVELAVLLARKGLTTEEILRVIGDLPGQDADQLSVEPPTGTDR